MSTILGVAGSTITLPRLGPVALDLSIPVALIALSVSALLFSGT